METKYDLLIIGAGACGLMILKEMAEAGYACCMLEANGYAGGRMQTITDKRFGFPIEAGAEFVHGKLPLSIKLLKEAGIEYDPVEGKMISIQNGRWLKNEEHEDHWGEFISVLRSLKTDMSIHDLLEKHFNDEKYEQLRKSVRGFAEGFDLADIKKASAMAALREWQHDYERQYRIKGGYLRLAEYLLGIGKKHKQAIYFNTAVVEIEHAKDNVVVHTSTRKKFQARKVVITVSAGILKSGSIRISPTLPGFNKAIHQIGFGSVIKIIMGFNNPFWKQWDKEISFLLTDEIIPTWWTQYPEENNLLTGWLGGPHAEKMAKKTSVEIAGISIACLASMFKVTTGFLDNELLHYRIFCWSNEEYVHGGYSFETLQSDKAKEKLSIPINDTIYIAGEALHQGESQGTVEAALKNGKDTAKKIINSLSR